MQYGEREVTHNKHMVTSILTTFAILVVPALAAKLIKENIYLIDVYMQYIETKLLLYIGPNQVLIGQA